MWIDLSMKLRREMDSGEGPLFGNGHIGTHFDVMNRSFPLEYFRRSAVVFHVIKKHGEEIGCGDVDLSLIRREDFAVFHTGYVSSEEGNWSALSEELIDFLLETGVSMIGTDAPGIRHGREHTPMDQYCADHGVFVVENMRSLEQIRARCTIYTFPMNFEGLSGLPCRIAAEI